VTSHTKKFEVFRRIPLQRAPVGTEPSLIGQNVMHRSIEFCSAVETLAEVAKTVAVDPSIAVRRLSDGRLFYRDVLAVAVERNSPEWLER
jgi:hypothetical protein